MRRDRCRGGTLLVIVLCSSTPADAANLKQVLAKPISPGAIALLVEHPEEAAVRERWAKALADPLPEVRAAAARVIDTADVPDLVPQLREALTAEKDPGAAREEIRALVSLGDRADDGRVMEAARRLGLEGVWLEALGRVRGPTAVAYYLSQLANIRLGPGDRRRFYLAATRGSREQLMAAASLTLGKDHAESWRAVLESFGKAGVDPDRGILVAALGAKSGEIRRDAAWHLALRAGLGPGPSAELRSAVENAAADHPADADLAFGLELLRRLLGEKPTENAAWIARLKEDRPSAIDAVAGEITPSAKAALDHLTPAERSAVSRRLTGTDEGLSARLAVTGEAPRAALSSGPVLRTATDFPKGLVSDLIAVSGCTLREPLFAAGPVGYRGDGRPGTVLLATESLSAACRDVAVALLSTSLAPSEHTPAASPEMIVVVLHADSTSCLDEDPAGPEAQLVSMGPPGPGQIQEPKKVVDVKPHRPKEAIQAGQEGKVVLESIISREGCVHSLRLRKGVGPALNGEAMLAVSGWRYAPTLLNGTPVPVSMAVTVDFRAP